MIAVREGGYDKDHMRRARRQYNNIHQHQAILREFVVFCFFVVRDEIDKQRRDDVSGMQPNTR